MLIFNQFLLVISPFIIFILIVDFLMSRYTKSINVDKMNQKAKLKEGGKKEDVPPILLNNAKSSVKPDGSIVFQDAEGKSVNEESEEDIRYIVTGSSGFIGSWISRFLIFRGATKLPNVSVSGFDICRSPQDLIKHGVNFQKIDLLNKDELKNAVKTAVLDQTHPAKKVRKTRVVIFHCAAVQRHYLSERWYDRRAADMNVKMAENLVDVVEYLANELDEQDLGQKDLKSSISVINISDAQMDFEAPNWWNIFNYGKWKDTYRRTKGGSQKRAYMSSYARSCAEAEQVILSVKTFQQRASSDEEKTSVFTTSLRVQGIVTGFYNDSVLSPGLKYGAMIDHAWSVPASFIHVDDVCRAAFLAENAIEIAAASSESSKQGNDEPLKTQISNCSSFLVSNGQMLHFGDSFLSKVVAATDNQFRDIRIFPVLVLLLSYFCAATTIVSGGGSNGSQSKWRRRDSSIFSGYWWTLTRQRFDTVQTVQVPDIAEMRKTEKAIGFKAEVSAQTAVDNLVSDYLKYRK